MHLPVTAGIPQTCSLARPTLFLLPSILTPVSHLQPPTPPTFLQPLHSLCITEDLGAGNERQTGSLTNCVSAGLCGSWPQAGGPGVFVWALCGWKGWPSLSLGKTSRLDWSLVPACQHCAAESRVTTWRCFSPPPPHTSTDTQSTLGPARGHTSRLVAHGQLCPRSQAQTL